MINLEETIKYHDMVPLGLCMFLHSIISGNIFHQLPFSILYSSLNLRNSSIYNKDNNPLKINGRNKGKASYFIYVLSKYVEPKECKEAWIDAIIKEIGISKTSYKSHKTDPNNSTAHETEIEFKKDIDKAIEEWKNSPFLDLRYNKY